MGSKDEKRPNIKIETRTSLTKSNNGTPRVLEQLSAYAKHVSPHRQTTLGSDNGEPEIPAVLDDNKHKYLSQFIREKAS